MSAPTSPRPRPASMRANRRRHEGDGPTLAGRIARARPSRFTRRMMEAARARSAMPTRVDGGRAMRRPARDGSPRCATLGRPTGGARGGPTGGEGDDAPARRERGRGDDRQVAQAARRPRRQVRAAARGHHRQGQRRGPVAVRGHPHRDPRRGGRDRPEQRRDRGHRDGRRGRGRRRAPTPAAPRRPPPRRRPAPAAAPTSAPERGGRGPRRRRRTPAAETAAAAPRFRSRGRRSPPLAMPRRSATPTPG